MTAVLVLSLICGLVAAYLTMHMLDERPAQLPQQWTIATIEPVGGGVRVELRGGPRVRVDTAGDPTNARNLALLYPGKAVTFARGIDPVTASPCRMLVPLLQQDRPTLMAEDYARLRASGLQDRDIAVSYMLPVRPESMALVSGSNSGRTPGVCTIGG